MTAAQERVRTRRMLHAEGVTDAEIKTSIEKGGSRCRLWRGAYVDLAEYSALSAAEQHKARIAAVATRTEGALVSHGSAAALHGLPLVHYDTGVVHFTRVGRTGGKRTPTRWMHTSSVPLASVEIDGIATSQPARSIIDLAATGKPTTALVSIDAAIHRGLTTIDDLLAELSLTPTRPGAARVRRAIALADGRSESPGETLARQTIVLAQLPPPTPQVSIYDEDGSFVARVDLAYEEQGIAIEFDGRIKYTALLQPGQDITDVVLAEKRREERVSALGWLVIRLTWDDLKNPAAFLARLSRALHERANAGPRGLLRGSIR